MVVRNFAGPAGQLEDFDTTGPRRQPSQPEIVSDGNVGSARRELPITSGLNLLTVGGAIGRDYRSPLTPTTASKPSLPSGINSSSSKLLPSSRVPRYNLKTIPPKSPNAVGGHLRPSARHVPGSYRSEVVPSPAGSIRGSSPDLDNRPVPEDQRLEEDSSYFGINPEKHSAAVDYLKQATTLSASHAAGTLWEMPSSKPPVEQARDVQPAEPVLTLGMDHEHSHGTSSLTSCPVPGSDQQMIEEAELAHRDATSGLLHEKAQDDTVTYAGESTLPYNGPQIFELLSQLPPVLRRTIHDLDDQQLTTKPSIQSISSVERSHSGHDEQNPLSIVGEKEIHQHRSTDLLSTISQKLSSVGKSISSLSETSLRSDPKLPSSHTSGKQEKIDLVNRGPRKYWMRQILAKASGSTTPVGPSSLTVRPNHSQRHFVEAADRERTASIPTRQLPTTSADEALLALRQCQDTESFARVIVDLESLLQEALVIAHQAAGDGHSHGGHTLGQDSDNSSRYTLEISDGSSTVSGGSDEEDIATTLPRRLPLRISISPNGKYDEERRDAKHDLSENARPHVPEATPELQVYPLQDAPESSKSIAHEALPSKSSRDFANPYSEHDWAYQPVEQRGQENEMLYLPRRPTASHTPTQEQRVSLVRAHKEFPSIASGDTVRHHVNARQAPPIQPRISSLGLRSQARRNEEAHPQKLMEVGSSDEDTEYDPYIADFDDPGYRHQLPSYGKISHEPQGRSGQAPGQGLPRHDTIMPLPDRDDQPVGSRLQDEASMGDNVSLTNRHHLSIREPKGFSLSRSHRRAPIARDWSTPRKRWVATVACISTALTGLIIGIYAGEVPAIQYAIVDEHHYTILGNVVFFIGLAITTALFWPLPLLHGRKPYTLAALAILLPLQFPQAIAVSTQRSPYVATYRVALLLPRAISGLIMGFANINFKSTLLDLFGASLQSVHPHQEVVKINDVRRHGGGMGVWLGIWTWCYIGSLGLGFLIGAVVISSLNVTWGFWITIILIAVVLVLNVLTPEVRRSAYRRSMAEVRTATDVSRRVARGEVKMHLQSTGPIWWWEEVWAGHVLCVRMLKQPGFAVLSLYLGWIYGQVVIVIVV